MSIPQQLSLDQHLAGALGHLMKAASCSEADGHNGLTEDLDDLVVEVMRIQSGRITNAKAKHLRTRPYCV